MFAYELIIRRKDEGKETAEEEEDKNKFLPFLRVFLVSLW